MKLALSILFLATATFGQGTLLWDESVNGPLSNDGGNPTLLGSLNSGSNSLWGATSHVAMGENGILYGDYFTFMVQGGMKVDSLYLNVDRPVLVWLGDSTFSQSLAYSLNPTSGNLLGQLGLSSIEPGTYGMYIKMNQFDDSDTAHYQMDFVQTVPEPSTISLALLSVGLLAIRFRISLERLR